MASDSLPSGWRLALLSEAAQVVGGGTPSRENPVYWNGHIPWATPTDLTKLRGRYISTTASSLSEQGLRASSARLLPPGSVLMTSRATIAVCAITTTPMATNQGFQSLVPREGTDTEYLFYALSNKKAALVKLAIDVFCYRARKYAGAYLAAMEGADAIVFTGGIGENSPEIRAQICEGLEWAGARLDAEKNKAHVGLEGEISSAEAALKVFVIPTDEELLIARDTVRVMLGEPHPS